MRSSANRHDVGFENYHPSHRVYLDGELLHNCVTADEELGRAWCLKTDDDGKIVLNEAGDDIEIVEVAGRVEIRPDV